MPNLFEERAVGMAAGKAESKLVAKYAKYKVLIMDEWLINPLSDEHMRFMLELGRASLRRHVDDLLFSVSA